MWCIPPEQNAEFVAKMEDVLNVHAYDEKRPVVCLDESNKQLIGEKIEPIPAAPGRPARIDHEYVRNGVMNLFMVTMPLLDWQAVKVTNRRTMVDFAEVLRWPAEEVCEETENVIIVMDNLNTHKIASLDEAFPPEQPRRIAAKFEIHHTPKQGSWLNMAEIELSVLARQCLDKRIESTADLELHVSA